MWVACSRKGISSILIIQKKSREHCLSTIQPSEAITQPPSRGPRAVRPGARVRRAGASGRCHVALPTGRTRGGIPVRCRRRAFSQQRISGRVRRRLPRADMSGTRLAGRQVSGTRCRHRAEDMQFPCQPAQASETSTSRRRRTGGARGDARRGPDGGAESGPRRTIPHHRRPGAPALFLLCAQRAQHIRRQSSGARARAVRAHPCCTWCTNLRLAHCTQTDRAGRPGAPALFLLCAQRAQHIRRQSSGARARAVRAHVLLHLVHKSQAGTAALRLTVLSLQAKSVSAFLGELANGKLLSPGSVLHETLRWYQLGIHTLQGQVHDLQTRNLTAAESARAQRVNEFQGLLDQAHRESADLRKRLSTAEAKLRTQACRFSAAEHAVEACKPDSAVRHCLSHGAGERQ